MMIFSKFKDFKMLDIYGIFKDFRMLGIFEIFRDFKEFRDFWDLQGF